MCVAIYVYVFVCIRDFSFWPYHVACGILADQAGMEPRPLTVEAQSPNHGTTREFPICDFICVCMYVCFIHTHTYKIKERI